MSSIVAQKIKTVLSGRANLLDFSLDRATENRLKTLRVRIPSESFEGCILQTRHASKHFYYNFAGGLENRILQILFSKFGYSCQLMSNAEGIAIYSDDPLDFSLIPDDNVQIKEIIRYHDHWNSFLPSARVGPFFGLLPPSLRKKEVLSQIDYGCTISNIIDMRNRRVISISDKLF